MIRFAGQTVEAARRIMTLHFASSGIETPGLDVRILLGAVLALDLTGLIAAAARVLTAAEAAQLDALVRRRIAGEPVARIVGVKEFWGLPLRLSPETLVPRPETETVVEAALEILRADHDPARAVRIADIGTGSGAILLALLSELPNATGVGTDISADALRTAAANAVHLELAPRASFIACDYAASLSGPFDLIVSNPPYVASADITTLPIEVRDHDPHRALDGGTDGLDAYRWIAPQAARLLAGGGTLVFEVGQHQDNAVRGIMESAGLDATSPPRTDLAGIHRVVTGRKPGV